METTKRAPQGKRLSITHRLRSTTLWALLNFALLFWGISAHAGINQWTSHGPEATSITIQGLAIAPQEPTTLYASTDRGVFRSQDGGTSWLARNGELTSRGVGDIAIDPQNPNTLYVTIGNGLLKSTDGGATWILLSTPTSTFASNTIAFPTIDPTTPTTVYAVRASDTGGPSPIAYLDLLKSLDSGMTWVTYSLPIAAADSPCRFYATPTALVIDPFTSTTLYLSLASSNCPNVFKSTDGGITWTSRTTGLEGQNVSTLAIDPTSPTTLYACTNQGLFKSTNGGDIWSLHSTGLPNFTCQSLLVDPITPSTLYVISNIGIAKSTDGGVHWTAINTGLTDLNLWKAAIHPTHPTTLYVGSFAEGISKSIDGGTLWVSSNTGLTGADIRALAINPVQPTTLYAITQDGKLFKSVDIGSIWTAITNDEIGPFVSALVFDPQTPTTLYLYTSKLFRSTDAGGTWAFVSDSLTGSVRTLQVDPTIPRTFYAGIGNLTCFRYSGCYGYGGIAKSTDGGNTWVQNESGLNGAAVQTIAIHPLNPLTLYAGTGIFQAPELGCQGVFKSTDGGNSWAAINTGITDLCIQALVVDLFVPSTIYAGSLGGLFKSVDSGATWFAINTGLVSTKITALLQDPVDPNTLYAGTLAGVFTSVDGGTHWNPMNNGLTNLLVYDLTIDPANGTILYAGTSSGVFDWQFGPTGPAPDLTGTWQSVKATCREFGLSRRCKLNGKIRLTNVGEERSKTDFLTRFYLSTDPIYSPDDLYLASVNTGRVKPTKGKTKKWKAIVSPLRSTTGQYVIAVIDAPGIIPEENEGNNRITLGPIP